MTSITFVNHLFTVILRPSLQVQESQFRYNAIVAFLWKFALYKLASWKQEHSRKKKLVPLSASYLHTCRFNSQHVFAKVRVIHTAFTYWPIAFTKPSNTEMTILLVTHLVSILSGQDGYTQWHLTYRIMLREQCGTWVIKIMNEKLICNKVRISDGTIQGIYYLLLLENGVWVPLRTCLCVCLVLFTFYVVGCVGRGLETGRSLFQGTPLNVSRQ